MNNKQPYVLLYGDDDNQTVTKEVWSQLARLEQRVVKAETLEDLENLATGAVLICIVIESEDDPNTGLASHLHSDARVVADIIALTHAEDVSNRIKIMAKGFDAIFNLEFMEYPDFDRILEQKVTNGFTSLENRIQQEEYMRFKAALSASVDAFIVSDEHNRIFFVSEHYRRAYPLSGNKLERGLAVLDAFDMCSAEQGVYPGDPRYQTLREFWETLDGEIEFTLDDGRVWRMKAGKLPGNQGSIVTTSDITHYKRQQGELAEALEKEQEASAIQQQFINMVSHEFRTPLSIIDGNAQLLSRRAGTSDENTIRKQTRIIRSAVSRLVNMMEGVLSSNMLKIGKLALCLEPTDLHKMLDDLCEEYRTLSNSIVLNYDLDDLPSDDIELDRKLITLVISNLLSNAVKFSGEQPVITIKAWKESAAGNDQLMITVEDNGMGIPEDERDKVFERYYRTASASGIPGTGIGLNLSREIIAMHDGGIDIETAAAGGTKFVITLPYVTKQKNSGAMKSNDYPS